MVDGMFALQMLIKLTNNYGFKPMHASASVRSLLSRPIFIFRKINYVKHKMNIYNEKGLHIRFRDTLQHGVFRDLYDEAPNRHDMPCG